MKPEIAIIGYGRFGKFTAHILKKYVRVCVADQNKVLSIEHGVKRITIREAAKCDVVILAVPINKLKAVLRSIRPYVKEGALICDACSVKEEPVRWMKEILPKHVSILGTHPLFGPDSASKGIEDKHVILCPVRIKSGSVEIIQYYLRQTGLHVHQMTAAQHDKLMASTLFLTQFIGHGLHRLPLTSSHITTSNFALLRHIAGTTSNDTMELFRDMYRYNRFAKRVPGQVIKRFQRLRRTL